MIFKNLLRIMLSVLFFAGSTMAYAAEDDQTTEPEVPEAAEVQLANDGAPISWAAFVSNLNNGIKGTVDPNSQVAKDWADAQENLKTTKAAADAAPGLLKDAEDAADAAQTAYDDANTELGRLNDVYDAVNPKYTLQPKDWLEGIYSAANTYLSAWTPYAGGNPSKTISVWYSLVKARFGTTYTLYLSFNGEGAATGSDGTTSITWKEAKTLEAFGEALYPSTAGENGVVISAEYVYIGPKYVNKDNALIDNGYLLVSSPSIASGAIKSAVDGIQTLTTNELYTESQLTAAAKAAKDNVDAQKLVVAEKYKTLTAANKAVTTAANNVTTTAAAYQNAQTTYNAAKAAYDEAQAQADANAKKAYETVTLLTDITVSDPIANFTGTILGNDNVITIPQGKVMFTTFGGNVAEAIIMGKTFTTNNNGKFTNVARWNSALTSKQGAFYNESGQMTEYSSLGELGYAARTVCGVDFAGKKLVKKADNTLVYSITTYANGSDTKVPAGTPNQAYATYNGTGFITTNAAAVQIGTNIFAVSADIIDTDVIDVPNLIYEDDNHNMVCKNVTIKDKTNLYCPVNFTAENLTYTRAFVKGYNTISMPFALSNSLNSNIEYICEYDTETPSKFWFNAVDVEDGSLDPNTPVLLVAKEAFSNLTATNIALEKSPADQMFAGGTNNESWGTLKKMTYDQVKGASQVDKIYALNANSQFAPATSRSTFAAFRMVLASKLEAPAGTPRKIGIRDSQGREVTIGGGTSAIEDVVADAPQFNIKGGVGELTITSDAEYGKVEIYTVDGRMAATAEVTVGTTSVSLQGGVYIVMGKKVLVK